MGDVAMPRLSDSMEEGTILKWLKSDGDAVSRGEELVEIETDKANMTYEADQDGTLSIVAREGDTLPVGETIARIGDAPGEPQPEAGETPREPAEPEPEPQADETPRDPAEPEPEPQRDEAPEPAPEPQPVAEDSPDAEGNGGRVKASPIARRMAEEFGVELGEVQGSGP